MKHGKTLSFVTLPLVQEIREDPVGEDERPEQHTDCDYAPLCWNQNPEVVRGCRPYVKRCSRRQALDKKV